MERMTEISRMMLRQAREPMNIEDAVSMLEECTQFRTFSDKLSAFSGGKDLRKTLTDGLLLNHPDAKRDAVDKKVRNWLGGRTQSVSKADAIELCFVLGLDVYRADEFISLVCEEGIHWRDPEEIAYGYALSGGMSYPAAQALCARVQQELGEGGAGSASPDAFTSLIRDEVNAIGNEDELISYLIESKDRLGKLHNTAYSLFMEFMATLEGGAISDGLDDSGAMSVKEVLENYLYRKMVPVSERKKGVDKSKTAFSDAQKSVRANWPDEASLSKMKSRQTDVTRKVLMLLFLVTNGGEGDYEDEDDLEWEPSRDEIFLNGFMRLNRMLTECGFQRLDPRSRFDWMVLYCMCVDDIFEVDAKLADFLSGLFPEGN